MSEYIQTLAHQRSLLPPPPPYPQVSSKPPLSVQSEWRLSCSPAAATLRRKGGNRTMRARERRGETCAFIEETCAFKGTCACTPNHWGGRFIRCSPRDRRYKATLPDPLYPALPHSTPPYPTLPQGSYSQYECSMMRWGANLRQRTVRPYRGSPRASSPTDTCSSPSRYACSRSSSLLRLT